MAIVKNFNILSKKLSDTTTITLRDPSDDSLMFADTEETQPLTIELYGRSSKQYRNWMSKTLRKQEAEKQANRGKLKTKPLEETLRENAEFLATVSIRAENFDMNGVAIDSEAMFVQLYSDPSLSWIGDQVSEALSENSNFLGK